MTANLHRVTPTARIDHYTDLRSVCVGAKDRDGNGVALFFHGNGDVHELAAAEAWLRNALAKVEDG